MIRTSRAIALAAVFLAAGIVIGFLAGRHIGETDRIFVEDAKKFRIRMEGYVDETTRLMDRLQAALDELAEEIVLGDVYVRLNSQDKIKAVVELVSVKKPSKED